MVGFKGVCGNGGEFGCVGDGGGWAVWGAKGVVGGT